MNWPYLQKRVEFEEEDKLSADEDFVSQPGEGEEALRLLRKRTHDEFLMSYKDSEID